MGPVMLKVAMRVADVERAMQEIRRLCESVTPEELDAMEQQAREVGVDHETLAARFARLQDEHPSEQELELADGERWVGLQQSSRGHGWWLVPGSSPEEVLMRLSDDFEEGWMPRTLVDLATGEATPLSWTVLVEADPGVRIDWPWLTEVDR